MTKLDQVRHILLQLGRDFTTDDLPKSSSLNSMLAKMEQRGEIERTGKYKAGPPGQRPRVVWRVGKLQLTKEINTEIPSAIAVWREVWGDMFRMPTLTGEVRVINKFSESSIGL